MFDRSIYHISINIRYIKPYITPKKWNLPLEKRLSAASPLSWWERDVVSPQGARKQGAPRAPAPGDLLILSNFVVNTDFSLVVDSLQYVEKVWMFNFIELLLGWKLWVGTVLTDAFSILACQPQVRTFLMTKDCGNWPGQTSYIHIVHPLRTKFYWFAIMRINLVVNIRIDM